MCSCVEESEEVQQVSNTNHNLTLQFVRLSSLAVAPRLDGRYFLGH